MSAVLSLEHTSLARRLVMFLLVGIGLQLSALLMAPVTHAQTDETPAEPTPVDINGREDYIVGGKAAEPGEWPWQALIHFGPYLCSGTLIHPEWILTAAHCTLDADDLVFDPTAVQVRLGEYDRSAFESTEQDLTVSAIIVHPQYDLTRHDNDVALLHLTTPATLGPGVQVIHPITESVAASVAAPLSLATVTGWGRTTEGGLLARQLMEVEVPIITNELCNFSYGMISDNMLCAGFEDGGYDACQGDSGGPLVVPADDKWLLAGVVSFGFGCARPHFYGVYARVSRFTAWLEEIIGPTLWSTLDIPDTQERLPEAKLPSSTLSLIDEGTAGELQIAASNNSTLTLQIAPGAVDSMTLLQLTAITDTVPSATGAITFGAYGFQLTAQQNNTETTVTFQKPITVSLYYSDANVLQLEESRLTLLGHPQPTAPWSTAGTTLVQRQPATNHIVLTISQSGYYQLGVQEEQLFLPLVTAQK